MDCMLIPTTTNSFDIGKCDLATHQDKQHFLLLGWLLVIALTDSFVILCDCIRTSFPCVVSIVITCNVPVSQDGTIVP